MTALEQIAKGICPECHSTKLKVYGDFLDCHVCSTKGNFKEMKWCDKVPFFKKVDPSEFHSQFYKYGNFFYVLVGTVEGCGRHVTGEYCTSCRDWFPTPVDKPVTRSKGKTARAGNAVREKE